MGEHLPCKQGVKGSNPFISTRIETDPKRTVRSDVRTLKTAYTVSSTSKIGKDIRKQDAGREGSRKAGKRRHGRGHAVDHRGTLAPVGRKENRDVRRLTSGQANKGAGRMPRHWRPKKDAISCEKPRGGANIPRSADVRMGKPA